MEKLGANDMLFRGRCTRLGCNRTKKPCRVGQGGDVGVRTVPVVGLSGFYADLFLFRPGFRKHQLQHAFFQNRLDLIAVDLA